MFNQDSLTESLSLRNETITQLENDAEVTLNKAKSIIFAVWKGEGIATTEQIADYFEVNTDTIKKQYQRHELEFGKDVKTIANREYKELRDTMSTSLSLSSNCYKILGWTPKAALRIGMMLTCSKVAVSLRDTIVNLVSNVQHIEQVQQEPNTLECIAKELNMFEITSRGMSEENKKLLRNAMFQIVKSKTGIDLSVNSNDTTTQLAVIPQPKPVRKYSTYVPTRPHYANKLKLHELTPENFAPQILHNLRYNQIPAGVRTLTASEVSKRLNYARRLIKDGNVDLINDALEILTEQGYLESLGESSVGTPKYKINVPKVNAEVQ